MEIKQSEVGQKLQLIVKRMYRYRSLILIILLFSLSMAAPIVAAQVPKSNLIAQRQQDASQQSPTQLVQQGKGHYDAGELTQALQKLQQAVTAFEAQGDKLNRAMALSNLSLIYQQQGQWESAKETINNSLALLESQPSRPARARILAQTLDIQGKLQREVGQPEDALKTWQEAAKIYTQIENKDEATQSQINQVLALQDLGLYPRACNTLLETLELKIEDCKELSKLTKSELTEKLQVPGKQPVSLLQLQGLRNLGDILRVMGQSIQSKRVLETSLNLANQLDSSPDAEIAAIYLSLGNTARFQNYTKTALKHYEQAAAKSATATTQMQSQLNQLSLLVETQEWSKVKNLWPKIQSKLDRLPVSRTKVYGQINLAQSLMCFIKPTLTDEKLELSSPLLQQCSLPTKKAKNAKENGLQTSETPSWATIEPIALAAREQASSLGDKKAEAYAVGYLGGVYQQMEKLSEARKYTEQALQQSSAFEAPNMAYLWQWQLGRIFKAQAAQAREEKTAAAPRQWQLGRFLKVQRAKAQEEKPVVKAQELFERASAAYRGAFESLKSLRGDLVTINPEIRFTFRDSVEPVYREYVDLLLKPEKPSQENLKQAREVIEALQLAEINNFFRDACVKAKPEQLDAIIDNADTPTAAIYSIVLPERLEIILKLPQRLELLHYRSKVPQNQVESTLGQMREELTKPKPSTKFFTLSQQVYDWLLRKVEQELTNRGIETLVFVLDFPLQNIPLAVLDDGEKYLVEKYALALSPGLQLLETEPLDEIESRLLTAGVSKKRTIEGKTFDPLPQVPLELSQIQSEVSRSPKLLDSDFVEAKLKQELESLPISIIHIATHGNFSSTPEQTYILLWERLLKAKDFDQLLRISDPRASKIIELLTLSACQTATGDKRATLGLAGVAVRSGARSTLATLWKVDDASTADLMIRFYQELRKDNQLPKAEALRRAQRYLLEEHPNTNYKLPYYWAPFVLVGNWL